MATNPEPFGYLTNNELVHRYATTRDQTLKTVLLARYERLIFSVLKMFSNCSHEDMEDLKQTAYLAFFQCLERFDAERGIQFSTYMVHFVTGTLKNTIRDSSRFKICNAVHDFAIKYDKLKFQYIAKHGVNPTIAQEAAFMGMSIQKFEMMREKSSHIMKIVSLDSYRYDADNEEITIDIPIPIASVTIGTEELDIDDILEFRNQSDFQLAKKGNVGLHEVRKLREMLS